MTTANVSLRGSELAQDATIGERNGGAIFINLERPPPVRSLLELQVGDERKAARVLSVDESGRGPGGPGCVIEWIGLDELVSARGSVGSEHIEGGVGSSDDAARPAPVVVTDEPSGVIDLNNETPEDATSVDASGEEATGGEDDASEDDAGEVEDNGGENGEDDGEDAPAKKGKRTKKRKGRKRG